MIIEKTRRYGIKINTNKPLHMSAIYIIMNIDICANSFNEPNLCQYFFHTVYYIMSVSNYMSVHRYRKRACLWVCYEHDRRLISCKRHESFVFTNMRIVKYHDM